MFRRSRPDKPAKAWAWVICAECGEHLPVAPSAPPTLGRDPDGQYVAVTPLDNTDVEAHMLRH